MAILTFIKESDRDRALQHLNQSKGFNQQVLMLGGAQVKPTLTTKDCKSNQSEFNIIFSISEDLVRFCSSFKSNPSSFGLEKGVKVKRIKIEHFEYLKKSLQSLNQINISFDFITSVKNTHFDIDLKGEDINLLSTTIQ